MADAHGISVLSPIGGVPMFVHAVRSVLETGLVDRVSVDVPESTSQVARACVGLPVDPGPLLHPRAGVMLRHDARRPLTPAALIIAVVAAVRAGHDAAVPVLPSTDTVKIVGSDGLVHGSPDRDGLRVVQAPRAWRAGLVDPDLVPAHAVPGDPLARAVRTAWDLELARLLVEGP